MSTARKVPSPDSKQHDLFGAVPAQDVRPRPNASDTGRRFVTGNPHEIVLGTTRLEDYLKQAGQRAPFVVAHLLEQQDWLAVRAALCCHRARSLRATPDDGSDPVWRHAGCSFFA
jgi:hypothetical protein